MNAVITDRLEVLNDEAHRLLPVADERTKAALHEACKWLSVAVLVERKRGRRGLNQ